MGAHSLQHSLAGHTGVGGATENNLVKFTSGLPADSGLAVFPYPQAATMWPWQGALLGGSLEWQTRPLSPYKYRAYTNGLGHSFSHPFFCAPGVYTFTLLGTRGGLSGIESWYVDDVLFGSTDMYTAGDPNLDEKYTWQIAGLEIATGGVHTLTGTTTGKNVASGGYYILMAKITLVRTGDLP